MNALIGGWNETYMDDEAAELFRLYGQTDADRLAIADALAGVPALGHEPTLHDRPRPAAPLAQVISLDAYRARRREAA